MVKRSTRRTLGVAAAVTLALVACGDAVGPNPRDVEFAASLGIDLDAMTETASGLFFRDDVVGTGAAAGDGDIVTVNFTGWTADGTQFDSGDFTFQIGTAGVIAGFVEGVTGMQLGGERTVVVPAALGFGSEGRQTVPGNAVLVFSLTLTALN